MAQAVSRRPLTAKIWVWSQASACCGLWWTTWYWKIFFSEHFVLPYRLHEPSDPYTPYLDKFPMVYNIISLKRR